MMRHHAIRTRILVACWANDAGWFRLFGVGLAWHHSDGWHPLDERAGWRRWWHIGPACITWTTARRP